MSQIRLSPSDRAQALERFGYTEREARFLSVAALHGGYFLRRQYAEFLGKTLGGTVAALTEKLIEFGHAQVATFAGGAHIYHLCARPFFAALGQEDNRNRRTRQPRTIKNKLMGLDFVLSHPDHDYLATEQEKLDYFTGTLGLGETVLPTKRYIGQGRATDRYFVEKFPIFVPRTSVPSTPVVSFCFIDEGQESVSGFTTFLHQYGRLFSALDLFEVIYVAASRVPFNAATLTFAKFRQAMWGEPHLTPTDPIVLRMLAHFEIRKRYAAQDWTSFDRAKLLRFRDDRAAFSGSNYEALYDQWQRGGKAAVVAALAPTQTRRDTTGAAFMTYYLEPRYDLFGRLLCA